MVKNVQLYVAIVRSSSLIVDDIICIHNHTFIILYNVYYVYLYYNIT